MINILNPKAEDLQVAEANGALKQGMWGFESGYNANDEIEVEAVNSEADAQKDKGLLGFVYNRPIDIEGGDSTYEDIDDEDRIIFVKASGVQVEDWNLAAYSTTADWANATYGTGMSINISGYLTLSGAADEQLTPTDVAKFLKYENGIVYYETL